MNTPRTDDDRSLAALTEAERDALSRALLEYFQADKKLPSAKLGRREPFSSYGQRALAAMIASLWSAGLLDKNGSKRDAAYSLTARGVVAKALMQSMPT